MMKNIWKIIFFLCLFLLIFCSGYMFLKHQGEQKREKVYEEISKSEDVSESEEIPVATDKEEETQEVTKDALKLDIPVDFAELQKINSDIYAWIEISDTTVDYPIVQSDEDDLYYLDHTIEGAAGYPGSIYTESLNNKDFTDGNTVIYGHNMRDGTMFGSLSSYMDSSYMQQHPYIKIYTPDHIRTYEVFAAVTYDDRHILKSYDFKDEKQYQEYLDSIYDARNMGRYVKENVSVTPKDRIITLSTCVGGGYENQRFLVEAVLIDEQ